MKNIFVSTILIAVFFNISACQEKIVAPPTEIVSSVPKQNLPQTQREAATPHFEIVPMPPEKKYKNPPKF
jgi:hypothetical protein